MRGRRRGRESADGERANGRAPAERHSADPLNTSAVLIPEVAGIKREDFVQDIVHLEVQGMSENGHYSGFE